jgi:hypothetical protein
MSDGVHGIEGSTLTVGRSCMAGPKGSEMVAMSSWNCSSIGMLALATALVQNFAAVVILMFSLDQ